MNKVSFAIALHFHQPIGNFPEILERAFRQCYKPLLESLAQHPQIKAALHISGCLLDYLEQRHPPILQLVKKMIACKQIELMGGAYYEPILTAIPKEDIIGQITMMSEYCQRRFGVRPQGMWVAERVWDPKVAPIIAQAGIRYIILDDEHLLRSGVKKEDMYGYFLAGKTGKRLAVFASDKKLRYLIPFKPAEQTIEYFKEIAKNKKDLLFAYGDDAEKFGEWPGTYEWVYQKQWLHKFFSLLEENLDWIKLVHFSDYLKARKPKKRLSIKAGSYEEMMEWSGGSWTNFLVQYPQAGQMHQRMRYTSSKLQEIGRRFKKKQVKKIAQAVRELYQGQCNCAYWHGVFGGLYLYHLRNAVYSHLIKADSLADQLLRPQQARWLDIHKTRCILDGKDRLIMENKDFFIGIDQNNGGVIHELDVKRRSFNLVNTLTRKPEAYHKKILEAIQQKEATALATIHDDFRKVDPNLKNRLIYDQFSRFFFRSYFLKKDLTLNELVRSSYSELGDFAQGAYAIKNKDKVVILQRDSQINKVKASLTKQVQINSKGQIGFSCSAGLGNGFKKEMLLGIEFNLTMPDLNSQRYFYTLGGKRADDLNAEAEAASCSSFGIADAFSEFSLKFDFSPAPNKIFYFPVQTVSQSERAYELNYQCSCVFPCWDLILDRDKPFALKITLLIVD